MIPIFCEEYFDLMDDYPQHFCEHQWALRKLVTKAFNEEELIVDLDRYEHYISLGKYLGFGRGYEWERYCIGCYLCTFTMDGLPRWKEGFFYMGRGAGKDGLISWMSLCLISPYNPVPNYDVDICAYNEDQALRPVEDVYNSMESNVRKMKKHFRWTKESIRGMKNRGYIKGHTNNAKGKDGLRSGAVFLNEIHTYENYDNINVFTTGLGKKKEPRTGYFTTNGDVIGGPLDDKLAAAEDVLLKGANDTRCFYFICKLDDKKEVYDKDLWHKANPSLLYKPELMVEIEAEFETWKKSPQTLPAFMTKRMNIRQTKEMMPVASWELISDTNRPLPDMTGWECTVGIDFSKTNDWVGVNAHFKSGEQRFDINHAWICTQSSELWRLKCPYREWAAKGDITLVDEPEISPSMIAEYVYKLDSKYVVKMVCLDSFRYALLRDALEIYGFSHDLKNIKLYRPSDVMRTAPVINRCFLNHLFTWGDTPHLRWATNNTKLVPAKKSNLAKDGELDMGNYLYGKIEPHARKTDPFMALVASMVVEDQLTPEELDIPFDIPVMTY